MGHIPWVQYRKGINTPQPIGEALRAEYRRLSGYIRYDYRGAIEAVDI
jgi:hypothetical protein